VRWLSWVCAAFIASGCCTAGPGRPTPLPNEVLEERVAELSAEHRFAIVASSPFVVVGGGRPSEVRAYVREVIGWATKKLYEQLFDLHPSRVVEIWALRTPSSYAAWSGEAIGGKPSSPYGVYAPCSGAIVVNRGFGDGTLIHEMVHVFVEVDFPGAPTWLNEGLGSLFEQSGQRDGRIVGLVNWRLPGLQRRLRAGTAPSLRELFDTSWLSFYGDESGLHYAMARYLLFDLQERGELERFYRKLRDGGDDAEVLKRIVGQSLEQFERGWRKRVLALRYPPS
jgi:hypothetical protein